MTGQHTNTVFEQWLMAYENHLEQVAQGNASEGDCCTRPPAGSPANDWEPKER